MQYLAIVARRTFGTNLSGSDETGEAGEADT
jgi:hypothetical protein